MKLLSQNPRWTRDRDGFWLSFAVKPADEAAALAWLDEAGDKPVELSVKRFHPKRSLDANAYAWVLIGRIAEKSGVERVTVYREAIRDIRGNSEMVCVRAGASAQLRRVWETNGLGWICEEFPSKIAGCVNLQMFYGSSVYDSRQMSRLIEHLIEDARSLGVETVSSAEMERLMAQWGEKSPRAANA